MAKKTIAWMEIHAPDVVEKENQILPEGLEIIRPKSRTDIAEHLEMMAKADYIIAGGIPITKEYMEAAPKLKMIQKWGIGVDKIDCKAAEERGIAVSITAGANSVPVAELAVGLMFAVNRKIPYIDAQMRQGRWLKTEMRPLCYMLSGKTVGLLGIGNIARQVAKMLRGFDVDLIYYDIHKLDTEQEKALNVRYVDFDTLVAQSDVLSVHVPMTEHTKGMIGEQQFKAMKNTAIVINTARGGVIDEAALVEALEKKEIRGAGIDSYAVEPIEKDNLLLKLENVVLTSHNGGGVIDNVVHRLHHAQVSVADRSDDHRLYPWADLRTQFHYQHEHVPR